VLGKSESGIPELVSGLGDLGQTFRRGQRTAVRGAVHDVLESELHGLLPTAAATTRIAE
jgi:hypothetical protein